MSKTVIGLQLPGRSFLPDFKIGETFPVLKSVIKLLSLIHAFKIVVKDGAMISFYNFKDLFGMLGMPVAFPFFNLPSTLLTLAGLICLN